jgi:aspartate carbamoyltransferase catalytic subunit
MTSRQHLTDIASLRPEQILRILDTAEEFRAVAGREVKKVPALRGRTIVNLFVEPSTRTRTSFEIAAQRLSADVVNLGASESSLTKGETLLDTARTLHAMRPDAIVLRHPQSGAAKLLSRAIDAAVINAGDGWHEHPTQALLDAMTIRHHHGRLSGLKVAIVGDIQHSRVARSNIHLLTKLKSRVVVCGPPTLLPPGIGSLGVNVTFDLKQALSEADVVITLRLQRERMQGGLIPSPAEYARGYKLTAARLEAAQPDAIVMHPGPINRNVEIDSQLADSQQSVILEQVANGVAVRMAVLYLLLGGEPGGAA